MTARSLIGLIVLAAALPAADTIHAGDYQGQWNGAYGTGNLSMKLERDGKAGYRAEVAMTVDPEEVDCDVESLKVDGSKFVMVIQYGGRYLLEMTLTGTVNGRTIEGRFQTRQPGTEAVDDEGTWRMVKL